MEVPLISQATMDQVMILNPIIVGPSDFQRLARGGGGLGRATPTGVRIITLGLTDLRNVTSQF